MKKREQIDNVKDLQRTDCDGLESAREMLQKMIKGNQMSDKKKEESTEDSRRRRSSGKESWKTLRSDRTEPGSSGATRVPRGTLKKSVSRNDLSSYEASYSSLNKKNIRIKGDLLRSKHKSFSQNDLHLPIIEKFNKLNLGPKNNDISTKQIDKTQRSLSSLSLNRDKKRAPLSKLNDNFSIDHIRFLTTLDDPTCIIKTLIKNEIKFEAVINSKLSSKHILIILSMLNKIYDINLDEIKGNILKKTLSVEFCENIGRCLTDLFTSIEFKLSKNQLKFVENLSNIVKYFGETFNYIANCDIFVHLKKLYFSMFEYLSKMEECPEGLLETMVHLLDKIEEREDIINHKIEDETYLNLSVYPKARDFLESEHFLEGNIVQGPYRDPEHYLGLHFQLLKEDFLDGLRNGIKQYRQELKGSHKKINHDVFVYRDVVCTDIIIDHGNTRKKILHCIEFDKKPLKHTDWKTTKRLIHGSLLVLSNDAFSTFCLAIMEDKQFSAEGYKMFVSLIDVSSKIKKFSRYDLIESRVFFEPYFQVLKTLKSIAPSEFPMKKYILYAETVPLSPAYLTPSTAFNICEHNIILSNSLSWPQCDKLKLNDSQMKALQAALTHEFTIIQGPPGTGKTYLGLKLIEVLIDNKGTCQGKDPTPIFIVCYRNQALDQMLEHLIEKNKKVVRLGGQTKSEAVERRTMKNVVRGTRSRHSQSSAQIVSQLKSQIDESKSSIHRVSSTLDLVKKKEGILAFKMLYPILTEKEIKYFQENSFKDWLNIENFTIFAENMDQMYTEETLLCDEDIGFHTRSYPNFDSFEERYNDPSFMISLTQLHYEITSLEESIQQFDQLHSQQKFDDGSFESQMQYMHFVYKYHQKLILYNRLENILNNLENINSNVSIENLRMIDLDRLNSTNRWILYKFWLENLCGKYEEELNSLVEIHNLKIRSLTEFYEMEDAEILLKADIDVVGATTTGAARLSKMIKTLRPKIVIIEEAAEVLEAHIITALTQHCQHLIMIGDHQQLRPSPASHKAAVNHRLDLSLFERMILNGMTCYSLEEQHRMRPSISSLMTPIFYKTLHNHESVYNYPHVLGVDVDLFFINHTVPEDKLKDTDSHRNQFESSFTLSLANYLMMQGYQKEDITILTTYAAQLQHMKQEAKYYDNLNGVQIQVVDNFQGEENKVILLSLVRSGSSTVGFLSKKNRVCVALSRAQHGLYIVGNMNTLTSYSDIWGQIRAQLDNQQAVGNSLPLVCKAHNTITLVSEEADFTPLTNGGCHLPCAMEMDCGHTCLHICHNTDLEHTDQRKCSQTCLKLKECGQHACSEVCGVPCSPCMEIVDSELPCGHILRAPCSDPPSQDSHCTEQVSILLKCGHHLTVTCGSEEPELCTVPCEDSLECGHPCDQLCHLDAPSHEGMKCTRRCERPNPGCCRDPPHMCSGQCGEECSTECNEQVEMTLHCGHNMSLLCSEAQEENLPSCPDVSLRSLPCGHELLAACSQSLEEIICEKSKKIEQSCGHTIEIACSRKETDEEVRCEAPVLRDLSCGHPAEVPCWSGDRPKEELDVECNVMVETELCCGHTLIAVCSQSEELAAEPCAEMVDRQLPCGHTLQGALCGQPIELIQCQQQVEKFVEECGHTTMMQCWEASVSANCSAPCTKVRSDCGHGCSGQCKDSCQEVACSKPVEVVGLCGHQWSVSCADAPNQKTKVSPMKCPAECGATLVCGHICEGSCGKCMQSRIHVPCQARCGQLLLCGHECEAFCWHELHYCKKLCSNKCEHAKCKNRCGDPCFQCEKSCNWTCEHYTCKQPCFEACDRPACTHACRLKLACGHGCMGFCGEPCPAVCYACDQAVEWTRYVYLEDCKHSVPEKELLEKGGSSQGVLVCTQCSLPVLITRRYRDRTKLIFSNLHEIKSRIMRFHWKQGELLVDLQLVLKDMMRAPCKIRGCQELSRLLRELRIRTSKTLQPGRPLRTNNLRSLLFASLYVVEMSGELGRLAGQPPKEVAPLVDRALGLVRHLKGRKGQNFCQAELDQYTVELCRLTYLIDLRQMETNSVKMQAQIDKVRRELDTEERLAPETLARLEEMVGFLKRSSGLFSDKNCRPLSPLNKYRSPTGHGTDWAKCSRSHLYSKLVDSACQLCAPNTTITPPPNIL